MTIKLDKSILDLVNKNDLKSKDLIAFILQNTNLHFKITDIKGALTRENVYNQLSLDKIYNNNENNIKKAYIKNDVLVLEF